MTELDRLIEIHAPTACPVCGGPVRQDTSSPSRENPEGVLTLYCDNFYCPGKLVSHLTYVGDRTCLDIDGLGEVLADQLVRDQVVYNLGTLWQWAEEANSLIAQIGEDGFKDACEQAGYPAAQCFNLAQGCRKAKTAGWDSWLMALGIPSVGKELAKAIAAYLNLGPDDMVNLSDKLLEIAPKKVEGLGPERLKEIGSWAMDPRTTENLQMLASFGVRPASTVVVHDGPTPLAGEVILVTGELGPERGALHKILESLGATIKTGVSKKVTLIVAGDGAGGSKLSKAQELGIRVEGREWLAAVFEKAGLTLESRGCDEIPDANFGETESVGGFDDL